MDNFSIIIPVYNEEKIIVKNTKRLVKFLNKLRTPYEIVICDNGSSDRTAEKGEMLQRRFPKKIKFIRVPERGVGNAFKKAVLAASYNNLISIDIDLAIDLDFIPKCLALLRRYSIVLGSKSIGTQQRPMYRKILSNGFIFLVRVMLGLKYADYSIGAKGYRKNDIIDFVQNGEVDYGSFYVTSLSYHIIRSNKKVIEIPVVCNDTRRSRFNLLEEVGYRFKKLLKFWFKERIAKEFS